MVALHASGASQMSCWMCVSQFAGLFPTCHLSAVSYPKARKCPISPRQSVNPAKTKLLPSRNLCVRNSAASTQDEAKLARRKSSSRSSRKRPPWSQVMLISPDFVAEETSKFRDALSKRLEEEDLCGDARALVVKICTTVFNHFLREYTGALLVDPFAEMNAILDDIDIDDCPTVAREALVWAQEHLEDDWNEWCSQTKSEP